MRGKEIITKLIIPGAIAMIICLIVHPMHFKDAVSKGKNRERAREQQKDRGQSL